jgi:Ubiquinone biosynthesis protein COQ7
LSDIRLSGYTSVGGKPMDRVREDLVRILQGAYSGELAAGLAYRGHWKSVSRPEERAAIQKIEREEAVHRKRVGEILASLGARPLKFREAKMWMIGRAIGLSCHALGRFLPMYFAGRLESGNVVEYEDAASHARALGLGEFETDLLVMARVEKEHELFFMSMVAGHRLLPLMQAAFKWGVCDTEAPEPSNTIDSGPEPVSQTTR